MQDQLSVLKAVIPVEMSGLVKAVTEYETLHGPIRPSFINTGTDAETFTNDVICFLTACELYEDSEYDELAAEWYSRFSESIQNECVQRYYEFLLNDAMSLSLSPHFKERVQKLKDMNRSFA